MKSFLEFDQQITEEVLDEVLSKDAEAGEWIDDFVKSDNPKFAGKSKEKRKQMALAAYYAKQRNEEVELDEDLKNIGDLVKASHDKIKASIASNSRKSSTQRNADNKDKILAKYKNIGKFIVQDEEVDLDEEGLKDACWKGYEAIGTKKKNGKEVPNCVPVKESDAEWEKSMEKQKHDRINDKDKDTLGKLAALMAKEKKNRPIKEAAEMTHAQIMKKIKDGTHEATTDIKPGKHVELRHNATGKTKMVMVKHNPIKEETLDESMDKMFKHVHPGVSDPKVAHKQAMDVVKNNQGKVRTISATHSEVDFPGGKSAVFKTSKEGDKVVTHIAHHNTYSEEVELDESTVTTGEYFKKHFDKAMAAKDAGDTEKFKQHYQAAKTGRYGMSSAALTKHKEALDKFKSLKESNLNESAEDKAAAEVHQNLVYGSVKHGAQDVPHHIKAVMKAHGAKDYNKVVDIVRKKGYAGKIDEEALDELSKGTLGSYVKKAAEQGKKAAVSKNQSDRGATDALTKGNERLHNLHTDNWNYQNKLEKKRAAGISKAVDKLTKEEALDELSKDTLGSYVKKSFAQGNELHQDLSYMRGDKATDAERKAVRDKISKRNLGVIKANKKLKEENQMISYSEFMAKLDESNASERAAEILAAKRAERLDKYDFSKEKQKPVSAVKQVKGHSYGADKPDNEDDEDENKKSSEPEVKRGRGRPSGSKSGARV